MLRLDMVDTEQPADNQIPDQFDRGQAEESAQ